MSLHDARTGVTLVGAPDLGWSWNPVDWVKSGASAIEDGAHWVADKVADASDNVFRAVKSGMDKACDVVSNPTVQQAGMVATMIPDPTAQTTGRAVQVANAACAIAQGQPGPAGEPTSTPTGPTAPPTLPTMTAKQFTTYPSGTIATFDKKRAIYRIAVPRGLSGLGAAAPYVEVAAAAAPPANAAIVSTGDFETQTGTKPLYKKPWFWAAVAGGVAVAGTGIYFAARR